MVRIKAIYYLFMEKFRRIDFQNKLFFGFLIVIILPMTILGIYSYKRSSFIMEEQEKNSIKEMLEQVEIDISKRISQLETVSDLIVNNEEIQGIISYPIDKSLYNQIMDYGLMKKFFTTLEENFNIFRIRLYLNSERLYTNEDTNIFNMEKLSSIPDLELNLDHINKIYWKSTYQQNYLYNQSNNTISAYRILKNISQHNQLLGVYFIDISEAEIYEVLEKFPIKKGAYICIIDEKGNLVSSEDKSKLGHKLDIPNIEEILTMKDGNMIYKNHLFSVKSINSVNWKIIYSTPMQLIAESSKSIRNFSLFIILIALFLSLSLSRLISFSILKRLNYLFKVMKYKEENDKINLVSIDPSILCYEGDEIDDLILTYNQLVFRVSTLISEVYEVKLEELSSKLKELESNINAHFLYNTLDSIKSCLEGGKKQEASNMITMLANFFRIAMSKGRDKITIKNELEMVTYYLKLQKMHYTDKFDWDIKTDADISEFLIPRFTLQPIIENALNHGIRNKINKGMINVHGYFDGDTIVIDISDNGVGMSEEKLKELEEFMGKVTYSSDKAYGLVNVNTRIKLTFGNTYGLKIQSKENMGTLVQVIIPIEL